MRSPNPLLLVLALVACGDNDSTTSTTSTTAVTSTGDAGSGETHAPTTTGTAAGDDTGATTPEVTTTGDPTGGLTDGTAATSDGTTAASGTTGSDGTTSGTTASETTGGATSQLVIAIVDAELYADCQPEIAPDPVQGQWYVQFDNTGGATATSAVLTKASLSLLNADPPMLEEIHASPDGSGPIAAGEQVDIKMKKLAGDAHSACDHCDEFYLLALEYQEGEVIHQVSEEVTISCAF